MTNKIKIVIVEDVLTDAELIEMELEGASISFNSIRVEQREDYINALTQYYPDIIISDYSLPGFGAKEALKIKSEIAQNVPFILVTGAQSEEIAVDCIKRGADDYILKSSLTRLPTSVVNALKKKRAEAETAYAIEELKLREEKYRNLF